MDALKLSEKEAGEDVGRGVTIVFDNRQAVGTTVYGDTPLTGAGISDTVDADRQDVPTKIREMWALYDYGDGSFKQKCLNFYRQGTFMVDYEDDQHWQADFKRYFPTYHDLNPKQLRGYFAWRTDVRKGIFHPIATSLAYLYLYELINGIGTASVEESLWKMQEFEAWYLDEGYGDGAMERNLHRWMLELAIVNRIPVRQTQQFANAVMLERDRKIAVLRDPGNHSDEEVFHALSSFATGNLKGSPVIIKEGNAGYHLFAEVWRRAVALGTPQGEDFLTACFGPWKPYPWYPLANAVYHERQELADFDYVLDECRIYQCRGKRWFEQKYDELYYDKKRLNALLHETDRLLRLYLKTGHPLRAKTDESWAGAYLEAVIEADRQAKIEAARPKIRIDLATLDHIREEAVVTRESLLTDEDLVEEADVMETTDIADTESITENGDPIIIDTIHTQILRTLLDGGTVDELIRTHRLMPSIVTDALNEAFFDDIGDNILDCDGERISLVEDYIEDVTLLLGH